MRLKDQIDNHPIRVFGGMLIAGFLAGIGAYQFGIGFTHQTLVYEGEQKALKDSVSELRAELSRSNQERNSALTDSQKNLAEVNRLQALLSQSKNVTRPQMQQPKIDSNKPNKLPLDLNIQKPAPSRWQGFMGYNNLSGLWRGQDSTGVKFVIEMAPQDGDEVVAIFSAERINCSISLRLVKATDDQLTTSNYFFKPITATAGCPDVESLMLRPFETFSDFRISYSSGKIMTGKVFKKI